MSDLPVPRGTRIGQTDNEPARPRVKLPVVFDYLGGGRRRMAVPLITGGVNSAVPDAQRDALLAKLAERATAHGI